MAKAQSSIRRKWNLEEIQILEGNYLRPRSELAKLLPYRSPVAIEHRLRKEGLVREHGKPWTEEETQILRMHYSEMSLKELKEKFFPQRSVQALLTKASRRLGLRKPVTFWCGERGVSQVREFDIPEKYYLAGVIDGEGTVTIKRNGKHLHTEVSIGNSCYELITRCREIVGVRTKFSERRSGDTHRKPIWIYKIASRPDVKKLLEQIGDALIVKRKQCELVLKFIQLMDNRPDIHEIPVGAQKIMETVRILNKRGLF